MLHRSVRMLGSALAVGAALLLSACGQQAPPPPNLPPAGEINQDWIAVDSPPVQSTSDTPAADPASPPKTTTKTTPQASEPAQAPSKEFFAATYVDSTNRKLVQRPSEFIPPNVTGQYASEVKLMNLSWSSWGDNGGIATGDAYITGGGGAPETVHGVRLILDNPQPRNGTMQYTHYMITWPEYDEPDEGQLNTL
ncbi:hypothetical protein [Saccharopolyspora sp. 5N708]|uniref:hypothetical protein n=1 Tax=Saccharopolyspora sp. 5N708 TaxID=3457424 RepID=UPI003FD2A661